jgi:hypothetical protein
MENDNDFRGYGKNLDLLKLYLFPKALCKEENKKSRGITKRNYDKR